jgi:regulatory protein
LQSEARLGGDAPFGRDPVQAALDLAWKRLARRDHTVAEIRRHLIERGTDLEIVEEVIGVLCEGRYLDDASYARRFAEDRRQIDAWGADRIEQRLLAAGVAPEHVATALSDQDAAGELDAAVDLLRRRFPDPPDDDRGRNRALGMLVRRGYQLDLAHQAIRAHERGE